MVCVGQSIFAYYRNKFEISTISYPTKEPRTGYYSQGWEFALLLIRSCSFAQNRDCERIAPVAQYKRATVSYSLPLLFTKAIGSYPRENRFFALSLKKNERFAQKTKEQILNPDCSIQ